MEIHKRSKYGENWDLSVLVEIIGRLQRKDAELKTKSRTQSMTHMQSIAKYASQPAPANPPPLNSASSSSYLPPTKRTTLSHNHSHIHSHSHNHRNHSKSVVQDRVFFFSQLQQQQHQPDLAKETPSLHRPHSDTLQLRGRLPEHRLSLAQSTSSEDFFMHPSYEDGLSSDSDDNLNYDTSFVAHFEHAQEALSLRLDDFVDYRYENGRYLLCRIIVKSEAVPNMILLHPVGKTIDDTQCDRLVDIYHDWHRLALAKSVCLKKIRSPSHAFAHLNINDYVDVRPTLNGHDEWYNAKIIKRDKHSSQMKVVYHHPVDHKNYSFWVHLLNGNEVAEFRSRCDKIDEHQIKVEHANVRRQQSALSVGNERSAAEFGDEYQFQLTQYEQKQAHRVDSKEENDEIEVKEVEEDEDEEEEDYVLLEKDDIFIPPIHENDYELLTRPMDDAQLDDHDICAHLLRLNESKWEFNNDAVDVYRLLSQRIDHSVMQPHPMDVRFPQYFSTIPIPRNQRRLTAQIVAPSTQQWLHASASAATSASASASQAHHAQQCYARNVEIVLATTTSSELIESFVNDWKQSLPFTMMSAIRASDFVLQVNGCHEYMLYDAHCLLAHYEAVREAVRYEETLTLLLCHFPNLRQIENECRQQHLRHVQSYASKYCDAHFLSEKIVVKHEQAHTFRFCPFSYGDGRSLSELVANNANADADADSHAEQDAPVVSNRVVIQHLPSMKDTQHLLRLKEGDFIFLHHFDALYNIKIIALTKVTDLPLYRHHVKNNAKKWCVTVRHQLWIGRQEFDDCFFETDKSHSVSDGMRFNASFMSSTQQMCRLPREACMSFTVYLVSAEKEIPIAFVRLPIVDECNILRCGKHSLNLWPIPVFESVYKGMKCDPFQNESFKYDATTIDRHLKRFKMDNIDDAEKELQNVFKLAIHFCGAKQQAANVVVALPLNFRWPYQDEDDDNDNCDDCSHRDHANVDALVQRDILQTPFSDEEKACIWKHRKYLSENADALVTFLQCIDWRDAVQRSQAYDWMEEWCSASSTQKKEDFLQLLSPEFMDSFVREFTVMRLSEMHDSNLHLYLLQFVQVLKYELHHNNALIRLLLRRALQNPNQIGHFLFWHLKSEYVENIDLNLHSLERFALYLEEYLLFCRHGHARDILIQCNISKALMIINNRLRTERKQSKPKKQVLLQMMRTDLQKLNAVLPSSFILPIKPKWQCTHLIVDECKLMSSAQLPMWLVVRNANAPPPPSSPPSSSQHICFLFKAGDDLRQDILTLQVLRTLDRIWLEEGLNLHLLPYNVVSTGDGQGLVEIVLNARTTTHIHTHYGGGAQKGARNITTHLKYIDDVNANDVTRVHRARDRYSRSCAAYCMASYVLGLGDRHPSNIMVRQNGILFHIDFAHFLGNFKSHKVIGDYVKWQREVAPFVFLPAYKYCIDYQQTEKYFQFTTFAASAYLTLRRRHKLLCTLFLLMLPSKMPELIVREHAEYLRNQLHLYDLQSHQQVIQHINDILKICLNDKRRIMDNMIHAMVHT
eukprot:CAMPEP_0202732442 /NCGR_PEP_ID=MMETSP1385-20130828/187659_1 /ASSEMBLY_ACC=CAM_ASM_000861 /TAXON_ID=933848 /ORGANISM="Elphidium margaritaceum" /LENGTH=1525 /DNA_ID=CAMNT_0049398755 /DNA_START=6 /DNA_END=4583 /DNA_ORIENTATION=+